MLSISWKYNAINSSFLSVTTWSGFGQDRVNFHQNPGRDTAGGGADPSWPNRAGYSITRHAGFQ